MSTGTPLPPAVPSELQSELSVPTIARAERFVAVRNGGYFPTMFAEPGGALAAVVRGGAPHVGLRSSLDLVRSTDGGRTWSAPAHVVPPSPQWDSRGSASGAMRDGSLVVGFWENTQYRGEKFDPTVGGNVAFFTRSEDGGKTWSPKQPLPVAPLSAGYLYGRVVTLADGTALMPLYGAKPNETVCWSALLRSRDGGRTWGDCSLIAYEFNEVTLLPMPHGRLLAFLRSETDGSVSMCESADGGRTWDTPRQLTSRNQHPADACRLASGHVLLTYGNRIGDLAVGAMLSRDGGRTWDREGRVVLARESLTLRGKWWCDTGYPSTVQVADGAIVTMYYRLGNTTLREDQQELCRQYERDEFQRPPAPDDMRRFEEAVVVRYREEDLSRD